MGAFVADHAWQLAALVGLLVVSAFFSGTETAYFTLSRSQLFRMARSRHRMARLAAELATSPRRLLNSMLLCNMVANVAYAAVAGVLAIKLQRSVGSGVLAVLVGLAPLIGLILLGEVAPKVLAFVLVERWAMATAPVMAAVTRLLGPVVTLVQATLVGPLTQLISPHRSGADLTTDELAALLDLSAKRGILGHDANELIQEIFDLSQVRVGELMVPRVDIVAYDIDADPEGLARLFRQTHLHKIPVYEGDIDHILGVVPARRLLLEPERPLRELTSEVVFVPEAATAERTLLQLRLRRRQIAIVVDEYGGTAGLITMEDVMEQIVGDIRDVHEQEPEAPVVRLSEREYLLDGDLAIHEWSEAFGTGLAPARVSTVGGLVASLLGRIPRNGDKVQYRNLLFGVESMRRRRVGKLRLELLEGER